MTWTLFNRVEQAELNRLLDQAINQDSPLALAQLADLIAASWPRSRWRQFLKHLEGRRGP